MEKLCVENPQVCRLSKTQYFTQIQTDDDEKTLLIFIKKTSI